MSDQVHPAPQAPPAVAMHAPTTETEASHSNFSRPTTSNAAAPVPSAATPASGAAVPPTPGAATTEEHTSLNSRLNAADRYWKFKGGLQAVAVITGLIGIGTLGWCVSTWPKSDYAYGYDGLLTVWPCLITFAVSIVWCLASVLALVARKKPVHPGLRVTVELFMWLGFLVTALFAIAALLDLLSWGSGGDLGYYYSRYGNYELAANGTWVWDDSSSSSTTTSYTRDCNGTSRYDSYSAPVFKSCAEQDAYINNLWQEKPHRTSVELTGVVCQFFGLVIHFALFVWACVDCHRYRRSRVGKDAEKMAAEIVQTMITNGAVMPPPGQAHVRPGPQWGTQGMGYYQLPPQGHPAYPMANVYPQGYQVPQQHQQQYGAPQQQQQQQYGAPQQQQQQYTAPQGMMTGGNGPVAGPSTEKSAGPRYA
jgi:hypothetical protein